MFPNIAALAAAIAGGGDPDRGFLVADIRPNAAGTAMVDYSPYGWTVTELGAGALSYDTEKVTFDGTNWLRLDIDPALLHLYNASEKLTLEITMSVATGGTLQRFVGARQDSAGGNHNWIHSITTGNVIETMINNSASTFNSAQTITPGVEFDFKWLVDGANKLVLVDNEPAGSADYNNTAWTNIPSEYLYIGAFASAGSNPLTSGSYIKRVRIYRGILKHDIAVPTEAFTSDADTECLVSFDGSATDESSNAHTITLNSGASIDASNKKFGSGSLAVTGSTSGASFTLSSALGTGAFTEECFGEPAAFSGTTYYTISSKGTYGSSDDWYMRLARFSVWKTSLIHDDGIPAFGGGGFPHIVRQRQNSIELNWADGKLVAFFANATNYADTAAYIGGTSTGAAGFNGNIDEYQLSRVARYTPTLLRDETAYDTPSAESGANYFASNFYAGKNGSTKVFTEFDVSAGAAVFQKNVSLANNPVVFDTERGATKEIYTNATDAEATGGSGLTAFTASGFTVGNSSLTDATGYNYRSEVFAATLSESITVDSQSVTLKHSGKGFGMIEIDRALGGASGTITIDISAMGLVSAPMVVVKHLDSAFGWYTWHPGLTAGYFVALNLSDAEANSNAATLFGNNSVTVDPTASAITLGYSVVAGGNGSTAGAGRIIVYVFGEVSADDSENYIKLLDFAYTNGQVSYVECGWLPALSWVKMRDVADSWTVRQTKRGTGLATALNSGIAEAGDYGAHGPFGIELNGSYGATGNIIGLAVRGN